MERIWLKSSITGEVRTTKSEKEARRTLEVDGWERINGRKDFSLYVKPKKTTKKTTKKATKEVEE